MDANETGRLEVWSLSFDEHAFLADLPIGARLAAAAQLKFLDRFGHFASQWAQIGDDAMAYLAEQLGADTASAARSKLDGRTARRHRKRILAHLGLRRMSSADRAALDAWLADILCPAGGSLEAMIAAVFTPCREQRLQPPARAEVERDVRAARRAFRERLLAGIAAALTPEAAARLEGTLGSSPGADGLSRAAAAMSARLRATACSARLSGWPSSATWRCRAAASPGWAGRGSRRSRAAPAARPPRRCAVTRPSAGSG